MRYLIIFALVSTLFACKKEEVPLYSEKDGIAFYTINSATADSTSYSFAFNVKPKTRDTVYYNMRLVGRKTNYDRTVKVVPGPGTTATLGVEFLLPEVKLPAGETELLYPIILIKTPAMTAQTFNIVADVAVNNDFILGATGVLPVYKAVNTSTTISRKRVKVSVTDRLVQPNYWTYEAQPYFGVFSQVKFRFMIDVLGINDFSQYAIEPADRLNFPVKLRIALSAYEAANGPLLDENGVRITF